ncbi:MAG TPA: ABC transporter ATP-binding protein [Caulobacterales bacterium]|jgi:lipopolysaccharide transport system ATP-binding protein|nr:ABC transporter ATP-binding protein [Caulobacterales bacterium]
MTCSIHLRDVRKTYVVHDDGGPVTLGEALRGKVEQRKVKRTIEAVAGISLDMTDGDRLGIIGPNGAGKSTLLQMITGVNAPTSGTIDIKGRVNAILTVGAGLREDVSGRDNFYLEGAVQGMTRQDVDAVIEEAIAFTELGEFIDRPVRTYSTGMKARLAFATISFVQPEILIIDEVLAVGDPSFVGKAAARMKALADSGRILLLVSHDLASVINFCNRCIWVEGGKIVMDGAPEAVVKAYEARQVAADEAEMMRKFEDSLGLPQSAGENRIDALDVKGGEAGEKRTMLQARQNASFSISGAFAADLAAPDLILRVTRVDGEILWEERLSGKGATARAGAFSLSVAFEPFLLGVNLYRVDVMLCDGDRALAGRSTAFQVIDRDPQIGGAPMLFYPPRILPLGIAAIEVGI